MSHFSENRHPIWRENEKKWEFAMDHYTGDYADWENNIAKVTDYLHQKYQRENNKAYEERKKVSDVIMHFATIVDGINGVLATKEKDTEREFGELGIYDEEGSLLPESIAYRLLNNADNNGTNLTPLMKKVGILQTILHSCWGLVEGVEVSEDGETIAEGHIKVIDPRHVVNWYPSEGELTEVLVKEIRDIRGSIYDKPDTDAEVFTLFTLDGWKRFTFDEESKAETILASGEYEYWDDSTRKKKILPIFRTEIPMPRQVGYLLAQKENHIYNATSVRDFALRNLSFAILNLVCDSVDEYNGLLNGLEKGSNIIGSYSEKGTHGFISPDSSYLTDFENVLRNKIEDYYTNGFKKFGEAASQVTATQVRLENQSGIEAFLALLVSSIDEFENQCYKRIEQVYFDDPSKWGRAYVKRSRNFQAEDVQEAFKKIVDSVKIARDANVMSVKTALETIHPTWGVDEIEAEIESINAEMGASIPDPFNGG